MKDLIKKLLKLVLAVVLFVVVLLVAAVVVVINPWNVPAIFKRNYPDWFEAHPFISGLIKIY